MPSLFNYATVFSSSLKRMLSKVTSYIIHHNSHKIDNDSLIILQFFDWISLGIHVFTQISYVYYESIINMNVHELLDECIGKCYTYLSKRFGWTFVKFNCLEKKQIWWYVNNLILHWLDSFEGYNCFKHHRYQRALLCTKFEFHQLIRFAQYRINCIDIKAFI